MNLLVGFIISLTLAFLSFQLPKLRLDKRLPFLEEGTVSVDSFQEMALLIVLVIAFVISASLSLTAIALGIFTRTWVPLRTAIELGIMLVVSLGGIAILFEIRKPIKATFTIDKTRYRIIKIVGDTFLCELDSAARDADTRSIFMFSRSKLESLGVPVNFQPIKQVKRSPKNPKNP